MNKNTENQQVSGDLLKLNKQNKNLIPLLFLLGISLVGFWAIKTISSNSIAKKEKPPKANIVKVATIKEQSVPVQLEAIGNVQSDLVVSITPQASGQITGVYFKKGQEVKKGQLLFTLDPRSQDASLAQARAVITKDQAMIDQARATLAKDQGQVEQARATLAKDEAFVKQAIAILNKDIAQAKYSQSASERYNSLFKSGAVSLDQAQQYTSTAQASKSTLIADQEAIANAKQVVNGDKLAIKNAQEVVKGDIAAIANAQAVKKTDQSALENLQVQASYTKIYSPIDGKAGNILINQGNIVQANSTSPLVTIARIRPIQVSFSIAEAKLPLVRKYISQGKLKVDVTFANDNLHSQGYLSFINNTIDSSTGTVQLIGDFENKEGHLFPGQFVNTTLTLSQMPKAKVVPSQSVQIGPNGQFVFVLDREDMTVQNVPVTATNTINGLSVLEKAEVEVGDEVVIDGQANLVSGDKVRVSSKGHHHSPKKDSDS
ncbi:MAG: efflux RND transporter periplasmic adaptor subunit [Cyanobacteriota bacterium ELA615]